MYLSHRHSLPRQYSIYVFLSHAELFSLLLYNFNIQEKQKTNNCHYNTKIKMNNSELLSYFTPPCLTDPASLCISQYSGRQAEERFQSQK